MTAETKRGGLVTVVVPVFNRPEMLIEAVQSVREQSSQAWEVVLVDDGSTDGTPEVIGTLVDEDPGRIRALSQPNRGPGAAREAGRLAARGEFLQFLDSDDLLMSRKLELQIEALQADPDAALAYGPTRLVRTDGSEEPETRRSGESFDRLFPHLLTGRLWITSTPLYRSEICERVGGWSDLRLEEDWEFEARIGALGAKLVRVEETVAIHRHHAGLRAGSGAALDPGRLRHQAEAHVRILDSARRAGVGPEQPEMAHFARALFLLSRKCGAAGLVEESRRLFRSAREASTPERRRRSDFVLYGTLARVLGWRVAGRLAIRSDSFRRPSARR